MKRLFLSLIIVLLCSSVTLWAQQAGSSYLPGRLIIKFEPEPRLNEIRSKTGERPMRRVETFLNRFGGSSPKPLLRDLLPVASLPHSAAGLSHSRRISRLASSLQRIHSVSVDPAVDPAWLAAKVSRLPGVEYAEPRFLRRLQYTPNDPLENSYEGFHRFRDAWDISRGSPDAVIAIIDSGVDYEHRDLDEKLWVNQGEIPSGIAGPADADGDGIVRSAEIKQYLQQNNGDYNGDGTITLQDALHGSSPFMDGADNDANGYADDLYGWDFWASGSLNGPVSADNNPMKDASEHGTHVTGIAAAETDNGFGIAGTGFRSEFMAVKAGGAPDDPGTESNEAQMIGFGPEGILYAAVNGADIINASWGGGGYSEMENEIIAYATSLGALVVGAAGNNGSQQIIYPAAYEDVLAVGSVDPDGTGPGSGTVSGFSDVGLELDVLATGSGIRSTISGDRFQTLSGTSMSAPVVSGLAALLRTVHPGWSARRIAAQIRSSAELVAGTNNSILGHGVVDAARALGTPLPGLRIERVRFLNDRDRKLGFEEEGRVELVLVNYGAATSGLQLEASIVLGDGIELQSSPVAVGSVAPGDSVTRSFSMRIPQDFNLDVRPLLRVNYIDDALRYFDFDHFSYDDLLFDTMAGNRVKMSVSANGTIGFTHPLSQSGGIGFIPRTPVDGTLQDGQNLLFEGGMMLSYNGTLHDAVRTDAGAVSRDFIPRTTFRLSQEDSLAPLVGTTRFSTADTAGNLAVDIDLTAYAFDDPGLSNTVILLYEIENPYSFFELTDLYLGLFNDWDIGRSAANNGVSFSAADSLLYLYDEEPGSDQPQVAVAAAGPMASALAIANPASGSGLEFGIYDGFSEEEKQLALSAGTQQTGLSGTDVSAVIASGPYRVAPSATVRIGFIYAFGSDTESLRSQVAEARRRLPFTVSRSGLVVPDRQPQQNRIFQNYPNPFNPSTRLRVDLSEESNVRITVYDILGREVTTVVDRRLPASTHIFRFEAGELSSGIYFARLETESLTRTIKMVLVK